MSLLSVDMVAEDDSVVEDCLSSSEQPTREASAKAARQERIKVEGQGHIFFIFVNLTIRRERISPMGCTPHGGALRTPPKESSNKRGPSPRAIIPIPCG